MTPITPSPDHEAAIFDLAAWEEKFSKRMGRNEMLALAAHYLGRMAEAATCEMTDEAIMKSIAANFESGRNVITQALANTPTQH